MPKHNFGYYTAGNPKGSNRILYFDVENNITNNGDIRDYSWAYDTQFGNIKQFRKELTTHTLRIAFYDRMSSGIEDEKSISAQKAYELFDRDVRTLSMGKLYINGWGIRCYIIESKKVAYNNDKVIKLDLTVLSDFIWHNTYRFTYGLMVEPEPSSFDFLDYQYDHEYDYGVSGNANTLFDVAAMSFAPFDFEMIISVPFTDPSAECVNPEVFVGNNVYRVYTTIAAGNSLYINSLDKKIYQIIYVNDEPTVVNEFNNRERYAPNNIFAKIPVDDDNLDVLVPEGVAVTITAFVERSEPPWVKEEL